MTLWPYPAPYPNAQTSIFDRTRETLSFNHTIAHLLCTARYPWPRKHPNPKPTWMAIAMKFTSASLDLKDLITFGIALIGAVLGIMNMWRSISHDKPKIKVTPKRAYPVGGADPRIDICIEAVNLGAVAVTVYELGLFHHGTPTRSPFIPPIIIDGGSWPRRLEPRTSVTVYCQSARIDARKYPIRCAYALTDCGLTFKGNSEALTEISRALAAGQPVK
jgi:hypothetical protein